MKPSILALCLALSTSAAFAQTAPAAASPTKKELVTRLLKLQQPGIEGLARNLALQPAMQMMNQANLAMQARVPAEKREAVAKAIDAEFKKYADDAVPLVRDRAVKLAPSTMGKLLEEKLSEDELKQVIAMLESPAYTKYMGLGMEQQKALLEKVTVDLKATIDPKLKTLEANVSKHLGIPASQAPKPPAK